MLRNCTEFNISYQFCWSRYTDYYGSRKVTPQTMPLTWQIMDETTVNLLNFNNLQG